MKTLTIGKLKINFSSVLKDVSTGTEYISGYGKSKIKVAVIVPYSKYKKRNKLKFGVLSKNGGIHISDNFKITDSEFLGEE